MSVAPETPLVPLRLAIGGSERRLLLKLEGECPGGSIKDRTARGLLAELERSGRLRTGSILVESTSGNLGVSLARLARARGYGFVAVVDPKTTPENLSCMRALGARIEHVTRPDPTGGYLLSRLARVEELCSSEQLVWTDQYSSSANPRAHELETGPELFRQSAGRLDAVVVAVSTGGTLAGLARFFRSASPSTRMVAVDAVGSVALGGRPGPRHLTGIGSSRRSRFLSDDLLDEKHLVADGEAFACCRALAAETGIRVGGSSGAVLVAAARMLAAEPSLERVACLCADGGRRYASTIFDAGWLATQGLPADERWPEPVERTFVRPSTERGRRPAAVR